MQGRPEASHYDPSIAHIRVHLTSLDPSMVLELKVGFEANREERKLTSLSGDRNTKAPYIPARVIGELDTPPHHDPVAVIGRRVGCASCHLQEIDQIMYITSVWQALAPPNITRLPRKAR